MAGKSKNEVTLVTGDGRRYRMRELVAKIVSPPNDPKVKMLGVFAGRMALGFEVQEIRGKKANA